MRNKTGEKDNLSLELMIDHLRNSGKYRVLEKYERQDCYCMDDGSEKFKVVFLDVETIGLDCEIDKIIELVLIVFEYSKEGQIFNILGEYNQYEDPGISIPKKITKLTEISDDMVLANAKKEQAKKGTLDFHNLIKRLSTYKDSVLLFINDFSISFTNNLS